MALTLGAYDDWARLEDETGQQFVTMTGGLDLYPPDAHIAMDDYLASMDTHRIAYDVLDPDAVHDRWPAFVLPDGTTRAMPEYDDCRRIAREHGLAVGRVHETVLVAASRRED